MAEIDQRLRTMLGTDPPESVSALPPDVLADLTGVITDARRTQAADLELAFDAALKHVPFPVRAIVKKVLL